MSWWLLWFISRSFPCIPKPQAPKAGDWGRWLDFRVCSWLDVRRWSCIGGSLLGVWSGRIYLSSQLLPWWLRASPLLCPCAMLLDKINLSSLKFPASGILSQLWRKSLGQLQSQSECPCLQPLPPHFSVFLYRPQNLTHDMHSSPKFLTWVPGKGRRTGYNLSVSFSSRIRPEDPSCLLTLQHLATAPFTLAYTQDKRFHHQIVLKVI